MTKIKQHRKIVERFRSKANYCCIMLEGLFNLLGSEIIGISTIVPLFLADYGASLPVVGALSTIQGAVGAIVPVVAGSFIATVASKRNLTLAANGLGRGLILLVPLLLLLRLPHHLTVSIVFSFFVVFFITQSISGISWNYLLGVSVPPQQRGKLLGNLFAYSGIISFGSSNLVRLLRESTRLSLAGRYASIFGLGGIFMALSVLFFIPLQEPAVRSQTRGFTPKEYLGQLGTCLQNPVFRRLLLVQVFSTINNGINVFLYVVAQNELHLPTQWISYMLVVQTLGTMAGGLTAGRISTKFGSKRTILTMETLGLIVPLIILIVLLLGAPQELLLVATFFLGFSKSAGLSYQNYLLELSGEESIFYIATKSLTLLPFTFTSAAVGWCIERFSLPVLYGIQLIVGLCTLATGAGLKLFIYEKEETIEQTTVSI